MCAPSVRCTVQSRTVPLHQKKKKKKVFVSLCLTSRVWLNVHSYIYLKHNPMHTYKHNHTCASCLCMHTQTHKKAFVCIGMTQHLLAFHCHGCLCCLPWALLLAQSDTTDINKEVGGGWREGRVREWERDSMLRVKHALMARESACTLVPFSHA